MATTQRVRKKSAKTYRHGDLRSALLQVAISSIDETGEVEFSLRDLSTKVGVTHAAAYRHFASKKDILMAIAQEGFDQLNERFQQVLQKDPADVVELGITYVRFATENPCHFKVMFHSDVAAAKKESDQSSMGEVAFGHLKSAVAENKRTGQFSDEEIKAIAITAWSAVHGLATLIVNEQMDKKSQMTSSELAEAVTRNLMKGFLSR